MRPRRGRTISTDCRRLFRSGADSPPTTSCRWMRRASRPPSGRRRNARTTRTRVRSISAHQPPGLDQREVQGNRHGRGQQRGEQRLPDEDADRNASDREGDDEGGGQVDPAGGDEGDGELGDRALPEQDLPDLEDDRSRAEEEERMEAERTRAAGVLEQADQPGREESLGGIAGEERGEARERQERLGPRPLEGPAVQDRQLAGQEQGPQGEKLAGAVLRHGRPPESAAARKSGGGTRTMTCSSERKSRSGSTSTFGKAPRPVLTDVTRPRLSPRGTPFSGSSVVRTAAPFSTGFSPPSHLSWPLSPEVPS